MRKHNTCFMQTLAYSKNPFRKPLQRPKFGKTVSNPDYPCSKPPVTGGFGSTGENLVIKEGIVRKLL